jgi:hypothetical protein
LYVVDSSSSSPSPSPIFSLEGVNSRGTERRNQNKYLRGLLRKINKTDKTEECNYNNKLDMEGDYRQQQQKELDEELGVLRETDL